MLPKLSPTFGISSKRPTKKKLKLQQGSDEQANSVMMQTHIKDQALQIMQLEKYTNDQQVALNGLIDRESQSRSDRSVPGLIETTTTPSLGDTTELTSAQALIASLTSQLSVAQQQRYDPNRQQQPGGPGHGGNRTDPGRGRGGNRQPQGVLGPVNNDVG